jgi:hypothetical protein
MKKSPSKKTSSAKRSSAKKSAPKRSTAPAKRGARVVKSGARATKSRAKSEASSARSRKTNGKSTTRKAANRPMAMQRADFGAPIDGFFAKQPPKMRPILEALREIVEKVAPDATASLKWGMPFYSVGGAMVCGLGGHKSHVNLILSGPPGTFSDPERRLEGDGKTGRRLTLRSLDELPRAAVRGWVRSAMQAAQAKM